MDDSRHNSLNSVINEFVKKLLKNRGGPRVVGTTSQNTPHQHITPYSLHITCGVGISPQNFTAVVWGVVWGVCKKLA